MAVAKLKEFLDSRGIAYESISHPTAYTCLETAQSAHISGKDLAKTVIIILDSEMAMAVLPSNQKVIMQDLRDLTGSETVRFASEDEFKKRFPDCEVGAMPPFGNLYGMEVFLSESLANHQEIAFNAGTHTEIIKMAFSDFMHLVEPKVLNFTT